MAYSRKYKLDITAGGDKRKAGFEKLDSEFDTLIAFTNGLETTIDTKANTTDTATKNHDHSEVGYTGVKKLAEHAYVETIGNTVWHNGQVTNDFTDQQNGYIKFPNGFIMQWGFYAVSVVGNLQVTIPFNIEFPNKCFHVQLTTKTSSPCDFDTVLIGDAQDMIDKTNFTAAVVSYIGVGPSIEGIYWFALGN